MIEYTEAYKIVEQQIKIIESNKRIFKQQLIGLINVKSLFNHLNHLDDWCPQSIVEIYEVDEKTHGYSAYQHARIKNDDNLLYLKTDCDEVKGISHYYVWQTTGYLGDDYSGFMLFPLKHGKYFKVRYNC